MSVFAGYLLSQKVDKITFLDALQEVSQLKAKRFIRFLLALLAKRHMQFIFEVVCVAQIRQGLLCLGTDSIEL